MHGEIFEKKKMDELLLNARFYKIILCEVSGEIPGGVSEPIPEANFRINHRKSFWKNP